MGRAQPWAGCLLGKKMGGKRWGLLCSAFFTRKIFRAADRRDYAREKSGVPQRFASWRNLLAVSSSDRAYKESPGRVSDRTRSPDLGLGRRLLAHSTHWKRRRTRCVPTSSSRVCSVSHLRCPESAGNFSHQPIRRDRAAAVPDFSHRFRTPQIRKRDVCRHHHRAFARSAICGAPNLRGNFSHQRIRRDRAAALPDVSHRFRTPQIGKRDVCRHHHRAFARSVICGALNLREISATSAFAEIAPPPFRMSPTDSGLRRLGKGR